MAELRITYQEANDIAYIHFTDRTPPTVNESRVCEEVGDPVETVIDMDEAGRVIGIELYYASRRLPEHLLLAAEIDGTNGNS